MVFKCSRLANTSIHSLPLQTRFSSKIEFLLPVFMSRLSASTLPLAVRHLTCNQQGHNLMMP